MSKAPAIYCRGRADGVRGDEATCLPMPVRHGHSRRARSPHATAPCLQQLRLAQPQEKCHGSVGAPTLPRSAALPPGPVRCPSSATGSGQRPCVASTLCWLAGMGEINCFRSKAKSMAFGHAFCFGSGSYLSFHDCAAWSSASGWMSSRYGRSADFSSSASLLPPRAALGSAVSPALCAGLPAWNDRRVLD